MEDFFISKKEPYDPIEAEKLSEEMPDYQQDGGMGEDKEEVKG